MRNSRHRLDGQPIQPLTTGHSATYVYYSHGVRLISRDALLDGRPADLERLLRDPLISLLLSSEGPMRALEY